MEKSLKTALKVLEGRIGPAGQEILMKSRGEAPSGT